MTIGVLRKIIDARLPGDIAEAVAELGFHQMFWQMNLPDVVKMWARMPEGFFREYYGTNADLVCPAAWTLRSRKFQVFTLNETYRIHERSTGERLHSVWQQFGMHDGVVVLGGRPDLDSFAVFMGKKDMTRELPHLQAVLTVAVTRLNEMLAFDEDLDAYPRKFWPLSDAQQKVVRAMIDYPALSNKEKAKLIDMSQKTFESHRDKIVKKLGVPHIDGAIVRLFQSGLYQAREGVNEAGPVDEPATAVGAEWDPFHP